MKRESLERMIALSKMYYEEGLHQEEIAQRSGISIAQVSRIINSAKKEGYIKISVHDPFEEGNDLRKQMLENFNLKDVHIVESRSEDFRITEENVAHAGADYLMNIVQANDIIGMAFSNIIYKVPALMTNRHVENVAFVQLHGAITEHVKGFQYDTIRQAAAKLNAFYHYFPAPAVVDNRYVCDALHNDMSIKWVMDMARKANIVLFSIGALDSSSVYVKSGYFTEDDMEKFKDNGAVGEIFGHFLNRYGGINSPELDARILGIKPEELRQKEYSICIVAGEHLTAGIYSALLGGYCNVLITDARTAKRLLRRKAMAPSPERNIRTVLITNEELANLHRPLAYDMPSLNMKQGDKTK